MFEKKLDIMNHELMIIDNYNAGFIVLSYLVSLVGCVTTLELQHRWTSPHGAVYW